MKAYQIVDADFVKREIGRMPIVDVRPPLRYDPAHIPSAINIRLDVAAASEDPAEELAEMFQDNGIFPEDAVIVYCQMACTPRSPAITWRRRVTASCICTPAV